MGRRKQSQKSLALHNVSLQCLGRLSPPAKKSPIYGFEIARFSRD